MYAVTLDSAPPDTIKVRKFGGLPRFSESGNLIRETDSLHFGCYLTATSLGRRNRGDIYGVYEWTASEGGVETSRINAFVKPVTCK